MRINLENFKKRLKALEEKVAQKDTLLSESQIAALEKKKLDDEACGEIEIFHLGYLLKTPAEDLSILAARKSYLFILRPRNV